MARFIHNEERNSLLKTGYGIIRDGVDLKIGEITDASYLTTEEQEDDDPEIIVVRVRVQVVAIQESQEWTGDPDYVMVRLLKQKETEKK